MPQITNGAVSGWTYFNLDIEPEDEEAAQNWVIVSMRSQDATPSTSTPSPSATAARLSAA
jgi:hypothetical protein